MRIDIPPEEAGTRLDQALANVEGVGSRAQAERLVREGLVLVNGKTAAKSLRLRSGDVVEVADEALAAPAPVTHSDAPVTVLYEDDDVLVVDKPAGMVVHPAPGLKEATLVELLEASGVPLAPGTDQRMHRPGVVHRLDRDTSGTIAFAKTPEAHRSLQEQLRTRTARREYTALVAGHLPSRAGRVEAPIGRDVRDASKRSIETDHPQDAVTHFVVTEVLPSTTLLRLRLETGRTHQIRVHLLAIGHPVVGDPTYRDANTPSYGLTRQFLHAARLTFHHPRTDATVEVASPLPADLMDALAEARRR